MNEMTGRCLCGAVTYTAEVAKTDFHACHCSMCRRWASSPFFAIGVESITFDGEDKISRYKSSDWAERGFCSQCGTNLFYWYADGDQYIMCIGTFDDTTPFTMAGEIYIDSKPPGYAFAGDHPRQTEEEFLKSLGVA